MNANFCMRRLRVGKPEISYRMCILLTQFPATMAYSPFFFFPLQKSITKWDRINMI